MEMTGVEIEMWIVIMMGLREIYAKFSEVMIYFCAIFIIAGGWFGLTR